MIGQKQQHHVANAAQNYKRLILSYPFDSLHLLDCQLPANDVEWTGVVLEALYDVTSDHMVIFDDRWSSSVTFNDVRNVSWSVSDTESRW